MQPISPNYNEENGVKQIANDYWRKFVTKLCLVSIAKDKDLSIRIKMDQIFFLFLPLFALYLLSGSDLFNMSSLS